MHGFVGLEIGCRCGCDDCCSGTRDVTINLLVALVDLVISVMVLMV
jgi:hypothetical protein